MTMRCTILPDDKTDQVPNTLRVQSLHLAVITDTTRETVLRHAFPYDTLY